MTCCWSWSAVIEEAKDGSGFTRSRLVVLRAVDSCLRAAGITFLAIDGYRKSKLVVGRLETISVIASLPGLHEELIAA